MKLKPLRHKETNVFKFVPFSERITALNVDVFHRVSCYPDDETEDSTFLHRAIEKWSVENLTQSLEKCLRELPPAASLPQLIHQKETAVNVLLNHLDLRDPLTLQAILELVVALARDLRHEFYPYFSRALESLFGLISSSKDPDVLEWGFQCMAYLLKFLWRSLLKEPASLVYTKALPLLQDSKPLYIKDFAAQSFAFVARKVRDKQEFIAGILYQLEKTGDGVQGTGRLLCETLCGVSGTLHSSSGPLLQLLFTTLAQSDLPTDLLRDVLLHTITALTTKVKAVNWTQIWTIATEVLQGFSTEGKLEGAKRLLELINLACEARGGGLVTEPMLLTQALGRFLQLPESTDIQYEVAVETAREAAKVTACLLNAPVLNLSQEITASLASQVLALDHTQLKLEFIKRVITSPAFELHILPKFITLCKKSDPKLISQSKSLLHLLSELVIEKSPPCHSGLELSKWKKYTLDLSNSSLYNLILNELDSIDNFEEFVSSIIILPHLKSVDEKIIQDKFNNLVNELIMSEHKDALFAIALVMESAVHMKLTSDFDINIILSYFLKHKSELAALRMLDLYLTSKKPENKHEIYYRFLEENVLKNLSSPHHKIRVLTCHIMSLIEPGSLLRTCLITENTPATIEDYRDRLQKLGNLDPIHLTEDLDIDIAIRFLIGQLYVNFKLLWEPVSATIASHALEKPALLWPIFVEQLQIAADHAKAGTRELEITTCKKFTSESLNELYISLGQQMESPDYTNFRCLLWRTMCHFPELCESRNHDVAVLFLEFLQNEYYSSEISDSFYWNVLQEETNEDSKMEVEEEESKLLIDESNLEEDTEEKPTVISKSTSKSLISHLELLSKLRNPKSMHRETELNTAYHELLRHKNSTIQKLAMDCIMQYRYAYLLPYKEQLYGLLQDKGFKKHLVMFNLETESDFIKNEHRKDLIPILMRILYSKMLGKSKQSGTSRRALILRFLSSSKQEEMLIFLNLAFRNTLELCQNDESLIDMVERLKNNVDLTKVVPPKRMTSTVSLVTIVLAQLGRHDNAMSQCTSLLLKILLCIASQITGIISKRDEVRKSAIGALRNSRKAVIDAIGRIFARSNAGDWTTTYKWTSKEFDAIFNAIVWPSVELLTQESVLTPNAVLRLFITWSENPKFFPLLVKHDQNNKESYPLACIIKLLNTDTIKSPVTSVILDLCIRLLTLKPDELEEEEEMEIQGEEELQVTNILPVDQQAVDRLKLSEPLNYGSQLLLPHIPALLTYLQRRATIASAKKKAKGGLSARDLTVLSRVSELVTEPEPSLALLKLIIPLCIRKGQKGAGDSNLVPLLTTAENLLRCIDNPQRFTLQIVPLLSSATGRQSRKIICNILFILLHKNEAKMINNLNSWDKKRLDEPDYERRINAYSNITKSEEINLELGLMVIHNCFYCIKNEKDASLRDCASHCLQVICPKMAQEYAEIPEKRTLVLERTIMEVLRRGVRDKNDFVQYEMLGLLGVMVRTCAQLHPTLRDLEVLACPDDLEVDFFENMRHLQTHRRSRAFLRFCQVTSEPGNTMRSQTLTHIILPLAQAYLCTEKYAKINSLIDSAIDTVGQVCAQLGWPQYEAVLKFQLGRLPRMLDYQKQLVRTVIAVLDAFHFDISAAPLKNINTAPRYKKNKKRKGGDKIREDLDLTEKLEAIELENENMESEDLKTETEETEKEETKTEKEETKTEKEETKAEDGEEGEDLEEEKPEEDCEILANMLEISEKETPEIEAPVNKPLSEAMAIKVKNSILFQFIPRLQQVISARSSSEMSHKVNKNSVDPAEEREREAQEVLRVPIAIAIVKLLQKLPVQLLEQSLTGVLLKVCVFLKSRLESTRRAARETLQQILKTLGAKYLPKVISELTSLLTRGYLVHILIYTVHALIVGMADLLGPGDIDPCLNSVLNICKVDMFGDAAEEKEVAQIAGKTQEARSHKSYDTLHLLARFVSEKSLTDLLLPLRDILAGTHSYKMIRRATACLHQMVQGLAENTFVSSESLTMFAYGAASDSLPALVLDKTRMEKYKEKPSAAKRAIQRPDTFLITPAPKRSGPAVKKSLETHAHLFIEFGLQLLHFLLKRNRTAQIPLPMLDPFIDILAPSLQSPHAKLTTLSLQCLAWLLKFDLPTLKKKLGPITDDVFQLLHKYAGSLQIKGDSFDLANAAFKVVGVLVRDVEDHTLSNEQLRLVLLYAERDVQDSARQATAFTLLKAILRRKMTSPELTQVLQTIAELSITAEMSHVRQQARQVYIYYLLEYPLGKQLVVQIGFLLSQLTFELETGRISALETLHILVSNLPDRPLSTHAGVIFVAVAARLVNDDSPECRKLAANLIKNLLQKLKNNPKEDLFTSTMLWFKDSKIPHKRLAAQLCGIFLTTEGLKFTSRLKTILPLIANDICPDNRPGRFVRTPKLEIEDLESEGGNPNDHYLYQLLQLLIKISGQIPTWLTDPKYVEFSCKIGCEIQPLLSHPHEWVRLGACQFLGCIFAAIKSEYLADAIINNDTTEHCILFFEDSTEFKLKTLTLDLVDQLQPGDINKEFAEQVVKNLVYLAGVLKLLPKKEIKEVKEEDDDEEEFDDGFGEETKVSLLWLAKKLRRVVNIEIAQNKSSTAVRNAVLRWVAGTALDLGTDYLTRNLLVLHHMLAPVAREITLTTEKTPELRRLAKQVGALVKEQIGVETFARAMTKLQGKLSDRRADRKRKRAQEVITNPEGYAKRKIHKHHLKREAKKNKINKFKGRVRKNFRDKTENLDF